jgi:hypothetical protein
MCVEADEIEVGINDASGTDGAKRRRVGDASGGASGSEALHEDGGSVRNSNELSATDLTQLAACDDLDLTEKESDRLARARGDPLCARQVQLALWSATTNPDATFVTTHARPAPLASSLPPAAPAPARTPLTGQASTSSLLETLRFAFSTGVSFSAGGHSATMPLAAQLASVPAATSLHRRETAFSTAAEPSVT